MMLVALFAAAHETADVVTVALDPGHGGTNLGAEGVAPGVYEKRVTLDIATRARQRLANDHRVRVVLCRDEDVLVPVRARVRCANEAGAKLFISIHANASPQGPTRGTQHGFELYVLPVRAVDAEAHLGALTAPNDADAAWTTVRTRALATESLAMARRLELELGDALGAEADRGIKQDGAALDVLQGLTMPGVLVEVGFIDSPRDGRALATPEGREKVAQALARAIGDLAARVRRAQTDPSITSAASPARRDPR